MLYYKATAGCGVWGRGFGGLGAQVHRPARLSSWVVQRCGRSAAPQHLPSAPSLSPAPVPAPPVASTLTGPIHRIPCSVVPPPRSSSSTYRIFTPSSLLPRPSSFGRLIVPARLAHSTPRPSLGCRWCGRFGSRTPGGLQYPWEERRRPQGGRGKEKVRGT